MQYLTRVSTLALFGILIATLMGCDRGTHIGTVTLTADSDTQAFTSILSAVSDSTSAKPQRYHWEKNASGDFDLYVKNTTYRQQHSIQRALQNIARLDEFTSPPDTLLRLPPLPEALKARMHKRNIVPKTEQAISLDWLNGQVSIGRRSAADTNALVDSLISAMAPASASQQNLDAIRYSSYSYATGVTLFCRIAFTPKPAETNADSAYYRGVNTPFLKNYQRQYSTLSVGSQALNDRVVTQPSIYSELSKIEDINTDHAKVVTGNPKFQALYAQMSYHPAGLGTAEDEVHWNSPPIKFGRSASRSTNEQVSLCHNHVLAHAPPQLLAWVAGTLPDGKVTKFIPAKLINPNSNRYW